MSSKLTSSTLPRDVDLAAIQILSPAVDGNVHITATEGSSSAVQLPTDTEVVRVAASGAVWLAFGGSGVAAAQSEADSMLFPSGAEFFFTLPDSYTYVAARSVSGAGSVLVTATKMI